MNGDRSYPDWLAQFSQGAVGPGDVQPANSILAQYLAKTMTGLATLPQRGREAAGSLQRGGSYDPGPAVEAALLTMGGTGFGAPKGAIGAGPALPPNEAATEAALKQIVEALKATPDKGIPWYTKPGAV